MCLCSLLDIGLTRIDLYTCIELLKTSICISFLCRTSHLYVEFTVQVLEQKVWALITPHRGDTDTVPDINYCLVNKYS